MRPILRLLSGGHRASTKGSGSKGSNHAPPPTKRTTEEPEGDRIPKKVEKIVSLRESYIFYRESESVFYTLFGLSGGDPVSSTLMTEGGRKIV